MALSLSLPCNFIQVCQTQPRVLSCRFRINAHLQSPELKRRSAHFKPTIWHDNFIQTLTTGDELQEGRNLERICKLKKEVSHMIYKEELLRDKLELIDALQQLGVVYHFKDEISSVMYESMDQFPLSTKSNNLYEASLLFRLLRMHGFSVHEDILKSYIDDNGHCKIKLHSDIKGILSLYEASYLAKEGEEMLATARHFTTKHLTNFVESSKDSNSRIKEHVAHALDLPLHWRMERLHTRWFIDQYKPDTQIKPALSELAVLDFNLNQNMYKKELKHVSRWWTNLGLYEKLPFIRDRLVENYLLAVGGTNFEPEHSSCRIAVTQTNCLVTTIDDIYDVYGSLDELEVFTNAIKKWDVTVAEALPENFRMCILALFSTVEDQGFEVMKEKGLYVTPYLRRAWKDLCKAYLVEARWHHNGHAPTLEEYLNNAWVTISCVVTLLNSYCANSYVTANDMEQFSSGYPDIVRHSSMIYRLYNDLGTSNDELERGDINKSIQCYMRDKNSTESAARHEIKEMIWKNWTILNGEVTSNSAFEKYFTNVAFNHARIAQCIYQHGDGYAKQDDGTKDLITSLFIAPVN